MQSHRAVKWQSRDSEAGGETSYVYNHDKCWKGAAHGTLGWFYGHWDEDVRVGRFLENTLGTTRVKGWKKQDETVEDTEQLGGQAEHRP